MPTVEELQEQLERERAYSGMLELHIDEEVDRRSKKLLHNAEEEAFDRGFREGIVYKNGPTPYDGLSQSERRDIKEIEKSIRSLLPALIKETISEPFRNAIPDEFDEGSVQLKEAKDYHGYSDMILSLDVSAFSVRIHVSDFEHTKHVCPDSVSMISKYFGDE